MNDRSTFRLSAHRVAWCAVNVLLWMPGLAIAVIGFLQWFGPRGATTINPNLAFLLSGLAVFALLFARNLAVALRSSEPPSALVVSHGSQTLTARIAAQSATSQPGLRRSMS